MSKNLPIIKLKKMVLMIAIFKTQEKNQKILVLMKIYFELTEKQFVHADKFKSSYSTHTHLKLNSPVFRVLKGSRKSSSERRRSLISTRLTRIFFIFVLKDSIFGIKTQIFRQSCSFCACRSSEVNEILKKCNKFRL